MAKKKIEVFIDVKTEREFEHILEQCKNKLICAEVYCHFSGSCTALDHLFTKIKLAWTDGQIVLLKVPADEITAFARFRGHSQPIFLFILNRKITKIFRGVDNVRFAEVAKSEWDIYTSVMGGGTIERPLYDLDKASPEEQEWLNSLKAVEQKEQDQAEYSRKTRQAARKRHRAEKIADEVQHLNFVLFWPHSKHAHPELYEQWDLNDIVMIAREEIQLNKELAEDILYAGDADINEASMHALLKGTALAICFRLVDTDKNFVQLVRKILYENIPDNDEDADNNTTAFDKYKSYSVCKEEILRQRKEEKMKKKEEKIWRRARRLSEMQRLAKQEIDNAVQAKKAAREEHKIELLKSGNLEALAKFEKESDDIEDIDIKIPQELAEDVETESSEETDEEEYFPPAGLLIPGFYAPPNDVAKGNGLAVLFPNIITQYVTPEPEHLPPHVLVMIDISKRYNANKIIAAYKKYIIHMGIFRGTSPRNAIHVAYSVKQFDSMKFTEIKNVCTAFMVAIKSDLALLALMDLHPFYVSRDPIHGEEDCSVLFDVSYGDHYPEFEDISY
ncbi:uncharacterized protein LOC121737389 [Aricia agestis]|uniref:uncharacterized protein LOC121737389 n=1 Tax=Aricia agestis TaxID=91739 RepID=UPI001C20B127|nr:uncharacterized protein LOC121737389 [Aricia agestis]